MNILLLPLITTTILSATVFFFLLPIPRSLLQWDLSSLYYPPLLHLSPPCVDQMAGFYSCPINTFLKLLGVAVRLNISVQASPPH